jgi:biopolymer transport protein TolR
LHQRVSAILRLRPKTPVLVRGDRRVPYGDVVKAMALLQEAGAPSVGLVTEPARKK